MSALTKRQRKLMKARRKERAAGNEVFHALMERNPPKIIPETRFVGKPLAKIQLPPPPPATSAHPITMADLPPGAKSLANLALKHGMDIRLLGGVKAKQLGHPSNNEYRDCEWFGVWVHSPGFGGAAFWDVDVHGSPHIDEAMWTHGRMDVAPRFGTLTELKHLMVSNNG
jgi:hypothetical protein